MQTIHVNWCHPRDWISTRGIPDALELELEIYLFGLIIHTTVVLAD